MEVSRCHRRCIGTDTQRNRRSDSLSRCILQASRTDWTSPAKWTTNRLDMYTSEMLEEHSTHFFRKIFFATMNYGFWTYEDDLESLAGPLTFRHSTSTSGQLILLLFVVWRCFTTSRWRTFWVDSEVCLLHDPFRFCLYVSRGFTKTWVG